jgi:hypothetical protein
LSTLYFYVALIGERHAQQNLVGKSETEGEIDKAIFNCREDMIKANLKETGCEEVGLIEPSQFRI